MATACVFATGLLAGGARRSSVAQAETLAVAAGEGATEGNAKTPLAMADALCGDGQVVGANVESCKVPGGAPITPQLDDDLSYEPAWMTGLRKLDFPFRGYARVEKYVHYWTATAEGRRIFRGWLKRSGKYRYEVEKALASRKLPLDLTALVFVESGFSPTAHSKAGAVGLWQLMPKTAKEYGLIIDKGYDERKSVQKSSDAAVEHLQSLYGKLGSWELVLAAYDMGARALYKKMQNLEAADFWSLSEVDGALPPETRKYVPQILAFALVLKNLDRFGYDTLKQDSPIVTSDLEVPSGVPLRVVAEASGVTVARIRELNPEFLRDIVPQSASVVHVPASTLSRARVVLPHLLFDLETDENGEFLPQRMNGDADAEPDEDAVPRHGAKAAKTTRPAKGAGKKEKAEAGEADD